MSNGDGKLVHNTRLYFTPAQLKAIEMWAEVMLTGRVPTLSEIAQACGINTTTLYRWAKKPVFREAINQRVQDVGWMCDSMAMAANIRHLKQELVNPRVLEMNFGMSGRYVKKELKANLNLSMTADIRSQSTKGVILRSIYTLSQKLNIDVETYRALIPQSIEYMESQVTQATQARLSASAEEEDADEGYTIIESVESSEDDNGGEGLGNDLDKESGIDSLDNPEAPSNNPTKR